MKLAAMAEISVPNQARSYAGSGCHDTLVMTRAINKLIESGVASCIGINYQISSSKLLWISLVLMRTTHDALTAREAFSSD